MRTRYAIVLTGVLSAALFATPRVPRIAAHAEDKSSLNSAVQRRLSEIIRVSLSEATIDCQRKKALEGLNDLKRLAAKEKAPLIPQIVLYETGIRDEKAAYAAEFLLIEHVKTLNSQDIITSIAPYLFVADVEARHRLRKLMDQVCAGPPTVDFQPIFSLMAGGKAQISDELVTYMFQTSPSEALLGYLRFCGVDARDVLLADREVSNTLWKQRFGLLQKTQADRGALLQLDRLSRHKEWWVRLYVAEIMRQHEGFRRPEIIENLKEDRHPLVRKTVAPFSQSVGSSGEK